MENCPTCGAKVKHLEPPDPSECEHRFQEFILEGIGPVNHCDRCGLAQGTDQEAKPKWRRFRVVVPKQPFKTVLAIGSEIIELEEILDA